VAAGHEEHEVAGADRCGRDRLTRLVEDVEVGRPAAHEQHLERAVERPVHGDVPVCRHLAARAVHHEAELELELRRREERRPVGVLARPHDAGEQRPVALDALHRGRPALSDV